jgi:hypothetical protein
VIAYKLIKKFETETIRDVLMVVFPWNYEKPERIHE